MNKQAGIIPAKLVSTAILLAFALLVLGSCAEDDYDEGCPNPSETDGLYAFCVTGYLANGNIPKDEGGIDRDVSTRLVTMMLEQR
jgi:hypothetical protein